MIPPPLSRGLVIAGFCLGRLLLWMPPCAAAPSAAPGVKQGSVEAVQSDPTQPHWDQVTRLLERRAYREALQEVTIILTLKPDDPRAMAYRQLCEKRLSAAQQFSVLSQEKLEALQGALQQEQQAQMRETVQRQTLQREIAKEQAAWDAELQRLQRQFLRERKAQERQTQLEETRRRQAMQEKIRELDRLQKAKGMTVVSPGGQPSAGRQVGGPQPTQQPPTQATSAPPQAVLPPPSTQAQAPSPPPAATSAGAAPGRAQPSRETRAAIPSPSAPSVELQPVIVQTGRPEHVPPEETVTPLIPQPPPVTLPPGAVQIFGDHMDVSSERRLATARGNVQVVFEDGIMTCDTVSLFTDTKDVYAQGHVRLERGNEIIQGEMVHYNVNTKKGRVLQGTAFDPPWYEHGRVIEHIAEGVLRVKPGYLTSCELDPPHFRLQGRSNMVFAGEQMAKGRGVILWGERLPIIYLPWLSVSQRQSPFFIVPGKKKPWGEFALMGYRYEWPAGNRGALRLDWRRNFLWGMGIDDQFNDSRWGRGLVKVYYNNHKSLLSPKSDLPKGAAHKRYRVLVRHQWRPLPDTSIVTDIQKLSDVDFRKDFLFREEFVEESVPSSFISIVTSDQNFTLSTLLQKRVNPFQGGTNSLPEVALSVGSKRIGETNLYSSSSLTVSSLQAKNAHSQVGPNVAKVTWNQGFSYALGLFRPIEVTPSINVQQTYYNKDKQGGAEGRRHLIVGQVSGGTTASLKLFRIFPFATNWLGLNINRLRHVLTPAVNYGFVLPPTLPNDDLRFPSGGTPTSSLTFDLENKLQTKRTAEKEGSRSVDLARFLISAPYTFRGNTNKQGGRLGDWSFKLETYPWPWLRYETSWSYPSHFLKGSRDVRIGTWNNDLVIVGGPGDLTAQQAPDIQAPQPRGYRAGPQQLGENQLPLLLPYGQWYLGLGHRYSSNDKTESVLQFDWRVSQKWQVSTFHRFTWKQVAGGQKRFNKIREYQYVLTRDLHDWMAELVYRVDREFGEELFFTMTLKAYPEMPIRFADSYHQPKFGSQSSPFSPLYGQHAP